MRAAATNSAPDAAAKHAEARERGEQHGHRSDQLAGHGLEERLRAAQRPDRRGQARGEQAFERGDGEPRLRRPDPGARRVRPLPDRRPQEPCRQQDAERDLVAVEDLDQLAHEHDLAHDGGESAKRERRPRAERRTRPPLLPSDSGFAAFTGTELKAGGAGNARTANTATLRTE